jgi:hypothetical protein
MFKYYPLVPFISPRLISQKKDSEKEHLLYLPVILPLYEENYNKVATEQENNRGVIVFDLFGDEKI